MESPKLSIISGKVFALMMYHSKVSLAFLFTAMVHTSISESHYSNASNQYDTSPLYNGYPPEGINPLALGFYATTEIAEPVELEIQGEIPSWITGSLYRGAQATWDVGKYSSEHWFDGFSRQHRFEIENGKVSYRSRNGSDEVQDFVRETGFYPGGSFGGDPCKAIFGAFEVNFRESTGRKGDRDRESVAVAHIKNFPGLARNTTNFGPLVSLVTTTDGTNALQQIDPVTLEPIELFEYDGPGFANPGSSFSAAHPGIGANNELYNYILDFQGEETPTYQVFAIEADGQGRILANITDAPPAYIHSVSSTENYVVLIIWQSDFGPPSKEGASIMDLIQPWDPDRPTFFYVIDKKNGGVIAKYTAPAFFAFHEVNSFEDGDDIVVDLAVFPDNSWLQNGRLEHLRKVGPNNFNIDIDLAAEFRRFRLQGFLNAQDDDPVAKVDIQIPLDIGNIELPRINDEYHHKPYRYAYGIHALKRGYFADSIVKIDIEKQMTNIWVPETNHLPSEPVFIPRPGCDDEDDGVLLTVAMDSATRKSNLVVIDAKTMKELGRAKMPIVMGYGFHGVWGGA